MGENGYQFSGTFSRACRIRFQCCSETFAIVCEPWYTIRASRSTALLTLAVCLGECDDFHHCLFGVVAPAAGAGARPAGADLQPLPEGGVATVRKVPPPTTLSGASGTQLERPCAARSEGVTLDMQGSPQRVQAMMVTPSFFSLVRTQPALGRAFTETEGEVGNEQKVILSDGLWRQMFGGDAGALQKTVRMGGRPYTVVGVMPRGFQFMDPEVLLWFPAWRFRPEAKQGRHNNNGTS